MLEELGVELIYANSSETKGKIEKMNFTIQNRLLNDIKRFNIKTYEQEIEEFSSQKIFGYTRYIGNIESSKMAKKYALQIWLEVYGKEVQRMKPYKVYWDDENNAWLVTGTLKKNKLGGIPYIIFSKDDGEIIAVWHTR